MEKKNSLSLLAAIEKIAKTLACPSVVLPRPYAAFSEGGTKAGRADGGIV